MAEVVFKNKNEKEELVPISSISAGDLFVCSGTLYIKASIGAVSVKYGYFWDVSTEEAIKVRRVSNVRIVVPPEYKQFISY